MRSTPALLPPVATRNTRHRGAHLGLLGSVVVLVTFFIPWVSCQGVSLSGMRLAGGSEGSQGHPLLFVLPIGALVVMGLAAGRYMSPTRVREHAFDVLQALLGVAGALAGGFVLISAIHQKQQSAFGGLIQIEPGMWLGILGFVAAAVGGIAWRGDDTS